MEREKERLEELKREADAKRKEEILAKRNELQRLKDQKMQARKQRMIDLVSFPTGSSRDHQHWSLGY